MCESPHRFMWWLEWWRHTGCHRCWGRLPGVHTQSPDAVSHSSLSTLCAYACYSVYQYIWLQVSLLSTHMTVAHRHGRSVSYSFLYIQVPCHWLDLEMLAKLCWMKEGRKTEWKEGKEGGRGGWRSEVRRSSHSSHWLHLVCVHVLYMFFYGGL